MFFSAERRGPIMLSIYRGKATYPALAAGVMILVWAITLWYPGLTPWRGEVKGSSTSWAGQRPDSSSSSTTTTTTVSTISDEIKYDDADRALMETCRNTRWVDGLWLSCHSGCGPNKKSICGGLNNARNRLQMCMRLAIDIGAGVSFPYVRKEDSWTDIDHETICPDVWWDVELLREQMAERCPRFKISSCQEEWTGIQRQIELPSRKYNERPHFKETFRRFVNESLAAAAAAADHQTSLDTVTAADPLLLRFRDSHIAWSYRDSGEQATLRKALFRVLRFNHSTLAVGEELFRSAELRGGNYVGIHLRAEKDWPPDWGTPEGQMKTHAEQIYETNLLADEPTTTIYVSTAEPELIAKFRGVVGPEYTVTDKWTLFKDRPDMLEIIDSLPMDQKAIVEYPVLTKGRYFQGNHMSTLSLLIAYERTMDQPEDFFDKYIYSDSIVWGLNRTYVTPLTMKGDTYTKDYVVNGQDVMHAFP